MTKNSVLKSIIRPLEFSGWHFIPILALVFGLSLFLPIGRASADYSNNGHSASFTLDQNNYSYLQKLGNGLTGNLNQLCLYGNSAAGSLFITLLSSDNNSVDVGYTTVHSWSYTLSNSPQEFCLNSGDYLNPDLYYFILFQRAGVYDSSKIYGSSGNNGWDSSNYNLFQKVLDGGYDTNNLNADAYFVLHTTAASSSVSIDFPTATTTADFNSWQISFTDASTSTAKFIEVFYNTTSTELISQNSYQEVWTLDANSPALVLKTHSIGSSEWGTWYAQAVLYDAINNINFAYSPVVTFNIGSVNPNYGSYTNSPSSTIASSTPLQITCDKDSGLFQYSLCSMFTFLFMPSTDVLNLYSTLINKVKMKPPIGYFYILSDDLSSLSSTSTEAFSVPQNAEVMDEIFTPFRTGFIMVLWVLFSFWIFHRIRKINL